MELDFVRLADLLRQDGSDPFKEVVATVRERFPGRGHAFDLFIKQLKPLASGFLTIPDINDGGRSARIRYWLNESAQGRGQNFKPVLLRWIWKHDEVWARDFIDRWQKKYGWPDELFTFPSDPENLDNDALKHEVVIIHFDDVDVNPLKAVANLLSFKGINSRTIKTSGDWKDISNRLAILGRNCLTVFYNSELNHSNIVNEDIIGAFDRFFGRRNFLAKKADNIIVLNQTWGGSALLSADGRAAPYLELPVGAPMVALGLEQAVLKLRSGSDAFYHYSESLRRKNAGQIFLEKELERKVTSRREGACITLFDIDKTNQINRRYGDDVGDKVIAVTEAILSQGLYKFPSDVGRCGDDTFYVAIYDGFNREGDMRRLNQEIAAYDWDDLAIGLRVTCSAGYSGKRPDEAVNDIVIRAALGLDAARRNGGNQLKHGPDRIPNATSRYIRNHFS